MLCCLTVLTVLNLTVEASLKRNFDVDNGEFLLLRKSKRRVYGQAVEYTVGFSVSNGCHAFPKGNVGTGPRGLYFHLFEQEVVNKLEELKITVSNGLITKGRSLSFATIVPLVKIFITVITNAYTAYALLTQQKPGGTSDFTNHNEFLRQDAKPSIKGIETLVDAVHLLNEDVHKLRKDLVSERDIFYALILNINSIYSVGMRIQALIDYALTEDKVDTKSLCQLMSMNNKNINYHCNECRERICKLDRRDTVYKSAAIRDMNRATEWTQRITGQGVYKQIARRPFYFEIVFIGIERDTEADIYEIIPFDHWVEANTPYYVKYVGHKYVLVNHTSNCAQFIYDQEAELVLQKCTMKNYRDPKLKEAWVPYEKKFAQETSTIMMKGFHYVYCYPGQIQIGSNEVENCPNDLIKIPATQGFNTSDGVIITEGFELAYNLTLEDIIIDQVSLMVSETNFQKIENALANTRIDLNTKSHSQWTVLIIGGLLISTETFMLVYLARSCQVKNRAISEHEMTTTHTEPRCERHKTTRKSRRQEGVEGSSS